MSEAAWEGGVGCRRKGANKREIIERLGRRKSLSATPQPSILAFIFILPFMPLCCLLSILPKISLSSKLCSSPWLLSPPSPPTPNHTEDLLRCHSPQGMSRAHRRDGACTKKVSMSSLVQPPRSPQPHWCLLRPHSPGPRVPLQCIHPCSTARGMEETALKDKRRRHGLNWGVPEKSRPAGKICRGS